VPPRGVDDEIEPGTYRVIWYGILTSFDMDARPFGEELAVERRVSSAITIERAP
jgi:hypothetical protein